MKKSEPKLILNLRMEDEEFERKIAVAVDDYIRSIIDSKVDALIEKAVEARVLDIVNNSNRTYTYSGRIKGKCLRQFVEEQCEEVLESIVEKNVKTIIAKKIADVL